MSSADSPKTVLLSGDPIQYEAETGAAVIPGVLMAYDAAGTVSPAAAETFRVARERDFIGEGIDAVVPSGDNVPFYVGRTGDRFYAWLADGAGNVATPGTKLEANADGVLIPLDTGVAVAYAIEDVDNSGGSEPARIRVEVL